MTRVPLPDGHSSPSDQGKHLVASATRASVPWHLAEGANMELPSDAAVLRVVMFPAPRTAVDWAALIRAARPLADLTLMGIIAPVATIYAARAAKVHPALTAAAVSLELALAYLAARASDGRPRAVSRPPAVR
jgi:hypothetical protein